MAADTFTSSLRIQLQGTGNNSETWGQIADVQFQKYEAAITGDNGFSTGGIDLTGQVSPYSLTANNGTLDQASNLLYPFSGTLTADMTVFVPGVVKIGWAVNATSGGHNVILKVGSGATLTLAPGGNWTFFYCDGANVIAPAITFGSGVGPITINGNATIHGTVSVDNSVTAGGGFISTALDDGGAGGQFRATFGSYGVMLRNDGANVYLLQTATGTPLGSFNAFRPFFWNLATGAVTIDGTGGGVTFGGTITAPRLQVAGTGGQFAMTNNGAKQLLNFAANQFLQFDQADGFTLSTTGNIHLVGAVTNNGIAVVTNNGGTWAINITGTAAAATNASAMPWSGLTGAATSQAPTFAAAATNGAMTVGTNLAVGGGINVAGQIGVESSTGARLTPSGVAPTAPWSLGCSINCGADVAATGFNTVSDRRAKSGIRDLDEEEALAWVGRGLPRAYVLNGRPSTGFIAQEEIERGRGNAVAQMPDEAEMFAEGDGYADPGCRLTRDYSTDNAYLTKALQIALRRIDELMERVDALEDEAV